MLTPGQVNGLITGIAGVALVLLGVVMLVFMAIASLLALEQLGREVLLDGHDSDASPIEGEVHE